MGPDHPSVATSLNNLAGLHGANRGGRDVVLRIDLQDRSLSVRLSQYADLLFRRPAFAFHSSDSFD